ncbi:MAG: hypothetical protein LBR37_01955 [Erysipelotrichaceae bacterium]|jgi:hypothetical protein|nr:hypothetical protein [Erysipelotrichaceae bacterium]
MRLNKLLMVLGASVTLGTSLVACEPDVPPPPVVPTAWTQAELDIFNKYWGEGNALPYYYFEGMVVTAVVSEEEGKFGRLEVEITTTVSYDETIEEYITFMEENEWSVEDQGDLVFGQIQNEAGNFIIALITYGEEDTLMITAYVYYMNWPSTLLENSFPDAPIPEIDLTTNYYSAFVFGSWEEEGIFFGVKVMDVVEADKAGIITKWNEDLVALGYEHRTSANAEVGEFYHHAASGLNSRIVLDEEGDIFVRVNNQDPTNY